MFIVLLGTTVGSRGNNGGLISLGKRQVSSHATPLPNSAYNPPKEIRYDTATDLKKELDTINPEVLDNDF